MSVMIAILIHCIISTTLCYFHRYFRVKLGEGLPMVVAMVAVLPPHHHLGHPPLLLLLLATVGVGGPSFPTIFQSDVKSSPIERMMRTPVKPMKGSLIDPFGPPPGILPSARIIFEDRTSETKFLLSRRTRSSPPHIDPYYR